MAHDTGFSRRSGSERDLQPVAIVSVDPTSRTASGMTRTRHTIRVNCSYATGDTITTPAVGEQWYVERFDMEWRLYGRIPFNDPTLAIEPEEGQVSVGSGSGPLELNGTEVRSNAPVFRLNGVYYRDTGTALERSKDKKTWVAIGSGGIAGLLVVVAEALADYGGSDDDGARVALEEWAALINEVVGNFDLFWNLICGNVFVGGLRRLGVGDTTVEAIINGFQNFVNYLFGTIFCDFDGDLTPQTLLARIRDLLAPIVNNPFVQGLQAIADILGVAIGNLLNDAVAGASSLVELIFNIITCNWDALAEQLQEIFEIIDLVDGESPFGPANIIKSIFNVFQLLGSPLIEVGGVSIPNPIGILVNFLGSVFDAILPDAEGGSLLERALRGLVEFVSVVYGVLTCNDDAWDQAALILDIPNLVEGVANTPIIKLILETLTGVLGTIARDELIPGSGIPNPVNLFLNGLREFYEASTQTTATNLADGAIGGAVEIVRLIFTTITCSNPDALSDFILLVDSLVPGDGTVAGLPQDILSWLGGIVTAIVENPLVLAIQGLIADFFPDLAEGSLIQQLLSGITNLTHWVFKIVSLILPFDDLWREALFPFIDWDAVDAIELPDLATILGIDGFDPLTDLPKILFKVLDDILDGTLGVFGRFISNVSEFFGDIFWSEEGFDLAAAIDHVVSAVLGIFNIDENGVRTLVDGLVNLTIDGVENLVEYITGSAEATVEQVQAFFANLRSMFGTTDLAALVFNITGAASSFIQNFLSLAPTTVLGEFLRTLEDTGYGLAKAIADRIILAIRGVPVVGGLIADAVEEAVGAVVTFLTGNVESGNNLLADPGAATARFWTPQSANVSHNAGLLAARRSGNASLKVVGGADRTFWWTVNHMGAVSPIVTQPDEWFYAECWVLTPMTNPGSGTITILAEYSDSTGTNTSFVDDTTATAAAVKSGLLPNWQKLSGTFSVPEGYDRVAFGFRLTGSSGGNDYYVDDMLVRETTVVQDVTDAVYQGVYNDDTATGKSTSELRRGVRGVSNLGRGTTQSGSNLLADPKVNYDDFWVGSAVGLAVADFYSRSTTQSLRLTSAGSSPRSFEWMVDDQATIKPLVTQADRIFYCECYVLAPSTNGTATATITLYAQGHNFATGGRSSDIAPMTFGAAGTWSTVTATNPTRGASFAAAGVRLFGYFKVPAGYDGFVAGIRLTSGTATPMPEYYFDDLVVQDVTEVVNTNNLLYNQPTPASAILDASVPTLGRSKVPDLQSTIDGINQGITGSFGASGAPATVTTALQNLNRALFRSVSYPGINGAVSTEAVPILSGATGRLKLPELQDTIDGINQVANKSTATGQPATAVRSSFAATISSIINGLRGGSTSSKNDWGASDLLSAGIDTKQAIANASTQLARLSTGSAKEALNGSSYIRDFTKTTATTSVALSGWGFGSETYTVPGSSSTGFTGTGLVRVTSGSAQIAGYASTGESKAFWARYLNNTTTLYQKVGITCSTSPGGPPWLQTPGAFNYIVARSNGIFSGPQANFIYAKLGANTAEIWKCSNGNHGIISSNNTGLGFNFKPGSTYWLQAGNWNGVQSDPNVFVLYENDAPIISASASGFTSQGVGFGAAWKTMPWLLSSFSMIAGKVTAWYAYDRQPIGNVGSGYLNYKNTPTNTEYTFTSSNSTLYGSGSSWWRKRELTDFWSSTPTVSGCFNANALPTRGFLVTVTGWYIIQVAAAASTSTGRVFIESNGTRLKSSYGGADMECICYLTKESFVSVWVESFSTTQGGTFAPITFYSGSSDLVYFRAAFLNNTTPVDVLGALTADEGGGGAFATAAIDENITPLPLVEGESLIYGIGDETFIPE